MREFIKYNRLRRLTNFKHLNFGKNIVPFIMLLFINNYFFPEVDNILYLFFQITIYISAIIFLFNTEFDGTTSLINNYPISNKKKKLYKTLYALLISVTTFLVLLSIVNLLYLITYLIRGEVTEGVVDSMPYSIYHLGFNVSMLFFYYFLAGIKRSKRWWGILVLGYISYIVINMISRYVLFNDIFAKKSIILNDYANLSINIYYFSIISLFIVSAIGFVLIEARNTKVAKGVN